MRKRICTVVLPLELTNNNGGRGWHWRRSAKVRDEIELQLRAWRLRRRKPFPPGVFVTITRVLGPRQRLWDEDSIGRGNAKELLDSLVALNWFVDDSRPHIRKVDYDQDDTRREEGPAIQIDIEVLQ